MKFYLNQLIVDDKFPTEDFFEKVKNKWDNELVIKRKDNYYVKKDSDNNQNYFSIHLQYGNSKGYSPEVVDATSETIQDNPKTRNQIETVNDLFVFYIKKEYVLAVYPTVSNRLLEDVFKTENENIVIKKYLISFDDFIKKMKSVKSIKLCSSDSLFRQSQNLMKELNDIYGFGAEPRIKLEVDFERAPKTGIIEKGIKKLKKNFDDHALDNLVVIGTDDKGFDSVFNGKEFNRCVEIEVKEKDENNRYEYTRVVQGIKERYHL